MRGTVQFLACDVLIDLGRTFAVGPVGAAKVCSVGHAGGSLVLAVAAKTAGAGAATTGFGTGVTAIEAAWRPVLPVSERLAVLAAAETAAVTLAVTTRTVAKGLTVTITERLPVTVTTGTTETAAVTLAVTTRTVAKGLTVTVAEGLPVTVTTGTTETAAVTLAVTTRTVAKGLPVTVAEGLPVTVTTGTTETAAVTLAVTTRTVTKRLPVTVAEGLTVTVTTGTTETAAVTLAVTTRTVTKRLPVTVAEGLTVAIATGTTTEPATVTLTITTRTITKRLPVTITAACRAAAGITVRPGAEATGVPAGIVVASEGPPVIAAVATVVLGHMDSSCCEPTTGATAAARFVSYATRNQALRSPCIFINSSGDAKSPGTEGALAAGSWPSSQLRLGPSGSVHPLSASVPVTPAHILQLLRRCRSVLTGPFGGGQGSGVA
ncbi:hypothetical protein [Arthrobacter sp. SLBN-112]|uniref:hypothetical protein n=1 Tax=Arthrobacter sp. SLBN-112 TaxID=2768452 RepID=UPI00281216C5|nr:hypothetical protein [Arthrobacter sp. SLBN-112]